MTDEFFSLLVALREQVDAATADRPGDFDSNLRQAEACIAVHRAVEAVLALESHAADEMLAALFDYARAVRTYERQRIGGL